MTLLVKYCMGSIALLVLALSLSACGLSGSAQTGEVLDEATEKPIEGAIVVAEWIGDVSANWADSHSTCYHVATAVTDDDGEYRIPGWSMKKEDKRDWHKNLTPRDVQITVYKAGYAMADKSFTSGSYEKGVYYLKPFEGSVAERLEYLKSVEQSTRCNVDTERSGVRLGLVKSLYEEARSIASGVEYKDTLSSLLYAVESIEVGEKKAFQNLKDRSRSE